jgi:hypothetical protein
MRSLGDVALGRLDEGDERGVKAEGVPGTDAAWNRFAKGVLHTLVL